MLNDLAFTFYDLFETFLCLFLPMALGAVFLGFGFFAYKTLKKIAKI
jgi:hypothetical protein